MKGGDLNTQLEALKRQVVDLVHELHARKLAIPAGALLLAIVAAVVVLPKASAPPPAPPTASADTVAPRVARVAQVSLVEPTPFGDDIALSNSSDPFTGSTGYSCELVSSNPKSYDCIVSDLKVRIICTEEGGGGPCSPKGGASDESGGSSGETGGDTGGSTPSTGDGGTTTPKKKSTKVTYYMVSVSLDGKTIKDVEAGDELPSAKNPLVVYAGTNDANNKGVFIAGDGVTVTGVKVDSTFGSFSLSKGQSATLTDANGVAQKLTLKSITKVTE